jgi:hypothetical protein
MPIGFGRIRSGEMLPQHQKEAAAVKDVGSLAAELLEGIHGAGAVRWMGGLEQRFENAKFQRGNGGVVDQRPRTARLYFHTELIRSKKLANFDAVDQFRHRRHVDA